jgi:hypothetical protein
MMTPGVPEDPAVLAGIAKVAIHHGHLDYALRLMVKSLAGVSLQVARDATEGQTTGPLIDQVRASGQKAIGRVPRNGQGARPADTNQETGQAPQ